ncbi:MAG: zinc ribbon domain-containing protein [Phycisphaerae bacterium]
MSEKICPHCDAPNEDQAAFCASCGKALPTGSDQGPRLVSSSEMADTSVGRQMQMQQLFKTARRSSIALIAVGVLTGIFTLILMASGDRMGIPSSALRMLLVTNGVLTVIYISLGIWARRNPLPASIVGLVVFLSLQVYNAMADPASIAQGWLIKLIIIIVLARAIKAGLNHRRLAEKMDAPAPGA